VAVCVAIHKHKTTALPYTTALHPSPPPQLQQFSSSLFFLHATLHYTPPFPTPHTTRRASALPDAGCPTTLPHHRSTLPGQPCRLTVWTLFPAPGDVGWTTVGWRRVDGAADDRVPWDSSSQHSVAKPLCWTLALVSDQTSARPYLCCGAWTRTATRTALARDAACVLTGNSKFDGGMPGMRRVLLNYPATCERTMFRERYCSRALAQRCCVCLHCRATTVRQTRSRRTRHYTPHPPPPPPPPLGNERPSGGSLLGADWFVRGNAHGAWPAANGRTRRAPPPILFWTSLMYTGHTA